MEPQQGTNERTAVDMAGVGDATAQASVGRRRCAMRLIRDPQLDMVLVYELVGLPQDPEPPTLVFEWGRTSFSLTTYPPHWRTLKDDELLALRHAQA